MSADAEEMRLTSEIESLRELSAARAAEDQSDSLVSADELRRVASTLAEVNAGMEALIRDRDDALELSVDMEIELTAAKESEAEARRRLYVAERRVKQLTAALGGEASALDLGLDAEVAEICEEIQQQVESAGDVPGAMVRDFSLGPRFLETLESLGVERYKAKTLKACADVVLGAPTRLSKREDHSLRTGWGGNDPARTRPGDGAAARRCYLEHNTASARRLHYWVLPDGSVEFASVNLHDDTHIPA